MRVSTASGRLPGLLLLAALALLAAPVLAVRVPPVLDYPNHAARVWLLAGGADVPPVSGFYAVDWAGASTNIGTDVLAAFLGVALPAAVLAPLFLVVALVLPPLGAAALNRAVFGGGWHWWQVGFAVLAWSTTLLAGFLNFQIGIGLALLAAAMDSKVARLPRPAAAACRAGLGAAVLLFHPFGLLFYAALLAGLAFGRDWAGFQSTRGLARAAGRVLLAAGAAAAPLAAVLLLAPALPGAQAGEVPPPEWLPFSVWGKLDDLFSAVRTYRRGLDLVPVALVAAPALWAFATGRLRAHAGLWLAVLGLFALLLASPIHFRTGSWIVERFAVMAVLATAAALRPDLLLPRRAVAALAAALLAVSAARTASVAVVWRERQADVAAVERALAHLPAGAILLPMEHTPATKDQGAPRGRFIRGHGTYPHYAVLAVPWRRAFVPTLFAMKGKQPIRVLPPWDAIAVDDGGPVSISALLDEATAQYWWETRKVPVHHLARWRERFDYVLVLNADMPDGTGPARAVPGLELVADEGFAQLHRVRRDGAALTRNGG